MDFFSWSNRLHSREPSAHQKSLAGPLIFPGAAVDADEVCLFHQTIDQGIAKRTLDSGKLLWTVQTPGIPLAVVGQNLWFIEGLSNRFRILALNTETGKTVNTSTWFDMLLGLPAIFDYNDYQGLSVNLEARWDASTKKLWIRIDGSTQYDGGSVPSPYIQAASRKIISMLVKVMPVTANISLDKTNHIDGFTINSVKQENKELPISFPSDCVSGVPVNSSLISSHKHRVIRSAKLSNYIVLLQILPVDHFSSSLLLLRVFSSDFSRLIWQQCIGNHYVEPVRC
ncbi:hypothetical protein H6G76_22255 [Nostoc sp. FACHB-152]|uniref:hypothetical protein n=1 Tax=unclassified Nostoc TaxID=2593658 RepID=UPI001682B940|nr:MULTISPECIES: hypothetical protein [unclassified Nostoc]MBD2449837.1 hypothetical protein [Nostoc sp. FACHB-152]MBD2471584.1 hypothetical protein [Nostoc sp. FACHB-145]